MNQEQGTTRQLQQHDNIEPVNNIQPTSQYDDRAEMDQFESDLRAIVAYYKKAHPHIFVK